MGVLLGLGFIFVPQITKITKFPSNFWKLGKIVEGIFASSTREAPQWQICWSSRTPSPILPYHFNYHWLPYVFFVILTLTFFPPFSWEWSENCWGISQPQKKKKLFAVNMQGVHPKTSSWFEGVVVNSFSFHHCFIFLLIVSSVLENSPLSIFLTKMNIDTITGQWSFKKSNLMLLLLPFILTWRHEDK